ncbi:PAS domain S-box protein [Romboutsia weinsteinii]|uniref:histidine kinase n=1 Tax=Romboutsia weinsteinii TaxID=2020949 RepID=A0A255HIF0_9FIRM|nr:ATP-binding protein [Romboutsia weinsteinii]RDY26295.1 PAS domain S-box protein [Romboutsia weinsteinii]
MEQNYSKDILESLLDMIPDYIFYRDLEDKNIYCNKSYANEFIGKTQEEILGKTYNTLNILPKLSNIGRVRDSEVINNKKPVIYDQTIVKSDGEKLLVEITKLPSFDDSGNVNGILGIMKDVSYRKELDKLREGFFANMKHEFRTPLNMILSSIQLLDHKCNKCDIENCKDCFINCLQLISTNCLRLLKLSNNFIDLTNFQTRCTDFSPRNYEIVNFVESICELINGYKTFNDISLIFDTNIEEKVISFDISKIERIILNLISNAIKFNKHGGSVLVSIEDKREYINISVKDTGIGIDDNRIDHIFDSFSNVENRLTKVGEGSSVGLALCKSLIEIHQGTIAVRSELGKGSEFIVSIPNKINENEELDLSHDKVDDNMIERIKMELSDIYA